MTCESCKYFFAGKVDEKDTYACRHSPPTVMNMMTPRGPITIGQWPPTRPENWCGSFVMKIAESVQ